MTREGARPYPNDGCIEAWLGNIFSEPDSADYWKLSPKGIFATYRGYQEDAEGSKKLLTLVFCQSKLHLSGMDYKAVRLLHFQGVIFHQTIEIQCRIQLKVTF